MNTRKGSERSPGWNWGLIHERKQTHFGGMKQRALPRQVGFAISEKMAISLFVIWYDCLNGYRKVVITDI